MLKVKIEREEKKEEEEEEERKKKKKVRDGSQISSAGLHRQ